MRPYSSVLLPLSIRVRSLAVALLAGLTAAAFAACGARERTTAQIDDSSPAPQTMTVTATDFQFDAPAQVAAGTTRIVMINKGREAHQVQLVRLTGGKTATDLAASMKQPGTAGLSHHRQ